MFDNFPVVILILVLDLGSIEEAVNNSSFHMPRVVGIEM
jgi:hypothetical protein